MPIFRNKDLYEYYACLFFMLIFNCLLLQAEAANMDYNEIFVKAVQTSETFVRKKWLGLNVKGKEFFSLPDECEQNKI